MIKKKFRNLKLKKLGIEGLIASTSTSSTHDNINDPDIFIPTDFAELATNIVVMSSPYLGHSTSASRYTAWTNQRHFRLSRHFRTKVRDASGLLYNAPDH
jgi:hypothetical protein